MLSLVNIKKAIVSKLKTLNINIVANEIRSGFDKPAFFVKLVPLSEDTDIDLSTSLISVNIHYFSEDKTELDNLKMVDKLKSIFINCVEVEDRTLTIYNKRFDINDNVLQFMFEFNYTEALEKEEIHEEIKELVINEGR